MNLKILNRTELDLRIKSLAAKERELLHEVLLTIKEIDGRRMYLEMGFSSLYSYLTEEVGYSDGYAQRRIDAARLLKDLPMLGEKIQAGTVNLSQTTLMQKAFRDAKNKSQAVSVQDKTMLLEQIGNKSYKQTQKEISVFLDLPIQMAEIKTIQADDSMRVTLYMSKELCEKLNRAQELLSHSLPNKELTAYLEYTADKVIEQKTAVKAKSQKPKDMRVTNVPTAKNSDNAGNNNSTPHGSIISTNSAADVASDTSDTKNISAGARKNIINSQACCQFKEPITGKVCQSKWRLQVDHKQPRWAGGSNKPENLQTLCRAHNIHKYKTEMNVKYMSS